MRGVAVVATLLILPLGAGAQEMTGDPGRGAGDTGIPGLSVDGICDEVCQQWLLDNLDRVRGSTAQLPTYYFEAGSSDPAGCGVTPDLPCQTLGKMNQIVEHGPARIRMTGDWDTTAEWGGAGEAGNGSGEANDFTNTALYLRSDVCPEGVDPCWIFEDADPDDGVPASIDCGGHDGTVNSGEATQGGTILMFGETFAHIAFAGVEIDNCPVASDTQGDIWRHHNGRKPLWLVNVATPDLQNDNNQLYTSHGQDGQLTLINSSATLLDGASEANQQVVWLLAAGGTSHITIFGNTLRDQAVYTSGASSSKILEMQNSEDGYWTVLRNHFQGTGADDAAQHTAITAGGSVHAGHTLRAFIGLNTFDGWVHAGAAGGIFRVTNSGSAQSIYLDTYRNSTGDADRIFHLLNTPADTTLRISGQCNLFSGATTRMIREQLSDCSGINLDLTYNVWDNTVTTPATLENISKASMQEYEDDSIPAGCNGGAGYTNVFGPTDFDSPPATEFADADSLLVSSGADAFEACPVAKLHMLQPEAYWPTWLTGARVPIRGFSFNPAGVANIGAR